MHNFTYNSYAGILDALLNADYEFSSFQDIPDEKKRVYLRHDLDLDLEKAIPVAEIERDWGIRSTYFIRMVNPYYNPFDTKSIKTVETLTNLGHSLGLHFDGIERDEEVALEDVEREVEKQHAALSSHFPVERIVSFHHAPYTIQNKSLQSMRSVYEPRFFSEIPYLSDSKSRWKEHDPISWIQHSSKPHLQLLTHPIWWGERKEDVTEHLREWLKAKHAGLDKRLNDDIEPYQGRT